MRVPPFTTIALPLLSILLHSGSLSAQPRSENPEPADAAITEIFEYTDEFYRVATDIATNYFQDRVGADSLVNAIDTFIADEAGIYPEFEPLWSNLMGLRTVLATKTADSTLSVFVRDSLDTVLMGQEKRIDESPNANLVKETAKTTIKYLIPYFQTIGAMADYVGRKIEFQLAYQDYLRIRSTLAPDLPTDTAGSSMVLLIRLTALERTLDSINLSLKELEARPSCEKCLMDDSDESAKRHAAVSATVLPDGRTFGVGGLFEVSRQESSSLSVLVNTHLLFANPDSDPDEDGGATGNVIVIAPEGAASKTTGPSDAVIGESSGTIFGGELGVGIAWNHIALMPGMILMNTRDDRTAFGGSVSYVGPYLTSIGVGYYDRYGMSVRLSYGW